VTFAFELESKDPSSILRSSRSVPMEATALSHDSRYRNPSSRHHRHSSNPLLPSERAALGKTGLATSWLAPKHPISLCPLSVPFMVLTYRTCEQPWQTTTVFACEKTVVMVKHPGHLTSMKKERGAGTRVLSLCLWASLDIC
jgi:hypothetical protein